MDEKCLWGYIYFRDALKWFKLGKTGLKTIYIQMTRNLISISKDWWLECFYSWAVSHPVLSVLHPFWWLLTEVYPKPQNFRDNVLLNWILQLPIKSLNILESFSVFIHSKQSPPEGAHVSSKLALTNSAYESITVRTSQASVWRRAELGTMWNEHLISGIRVKPYIEQFR